MKFLILLSISNILVVASASLWSTYKLIHSKKYSSEFEEAKRYSIWHTNSKNIEEHNDKFLKGQATFKMAPNQFTDLTYEEALQKFAGAKIAYDLNESKCLNKSSVIKMSRVSLPTSVDYRNTVFVGSIKNQGLCGYD